MLKFGNYAQCVRHFIFHQIFRVSVPFVNPIIRKSDPIMVTYEKQLFCEPWNDTIEPIMNGLKNIFKHHPGTMTDLDINIGQYDDGADIKIRLTFEYSADTDDSDNPVLDDTDIKTKFLTITGDDDATETEWKLMKV